MITSTRTTSRKAWATSVAIHAWLLAVLIWLPIGAKQPPSPPITILELTTADLSSTGDRQSEHATAPQALQARPTAEHPHQAPERRSGKPQEGLPDLESELPAHSAAATADVAKAPDASKLALELTRRHAVEEQIQDQGDQGSDTHATLVDGNDNRSAEAGVVNSGDVGSGGLSGRKLLHAATPAYPVAAEARQAEGVVYAHIRVAPDGRVDEVALARSAGDPDLDRAALSAFRQWRFSPLPAGHEVVDQEGEVRIRFELR